MFILKKNNSIFERKSHASEHRRQHVGTALEHAALPSHCLALQKNSLTQGAAQI